MGIEGGFSRCTRPPGILKVLHHFFLNTVEPVKVSPSGVAARFFEHKSVFIFLDFSVLEAPQGEKPAFIYYIGTQRNNAIDMEHALIRGAEGSLTFAPPVGTNHVRIYQFNPLFGWKTKQ